MCGIAGFCDFNQNYFKEEMKWRDTLVTMREAIRRRGPDDSGDYLEENVGFSHTRLAVIDLETGRQPMVKRDGDRTFAIVYNGELYNMPELKQDLIRKGCHFESKSDTEVVLNGFIKEGFDFIHRLNGIYACAIWDAEQVYLIRDRAGIKPLFYALRDSGLVFASEIKGLLAYPGMDPIIDLEGLCEIFAVGPARTPGCGVFKGINEIKPGHYAIYNRDGLHIEKYWDVESKPHLDSYEDTIEKTATLLQDAVRRQMIADVPICSFLSGGVDSSVVTAIAAAELGRLGKQMNTFSFDFEGNDAYFQSNAFQPDRDRPWVDKMVDFCGSNHRYLKCSTQDMVDALFEAVDAKDLPGMADVESSLLYFCKQVSGYNKVALTGECADEIFGGYPWFHHPDAFETQAFPWTRDTSPRKLLLSGELLNAIDIDAYTTKRYLETIEAVPRLDGENAQEQRRREIAYLNLKWFMVTLLDRMDRTSMYSGLEARVPFADYRIIEYIWNVPWAFKCKDGVVKGLLREASRGLLPDEVLFRKKSPYPKSYHPDYEKKVGNMLLERMNDSMSPLKRLLNIEQVEKFVQAPKDYGKPWFGQLMAGPQLMAYMLQFDYWVRKYNIRLSW